MRHFEQSEFEKELEQEDYAWQHLHGPYTPVFGRQKVRAFGKIKSKDRQYALLERGRVPCHCVGGIAMDDSDLQKLIKKGFMKFDRFPYSTGWGGNYKLSRTFAVITDKGQNYLNARVA